MTTPTSPARRTLIAILASIAVVVIIALIVVFTRGTPALLDESTPEGVVQRYSVAVIDGDDEAALGYLSDDAKEKCGRVDNTVDSGIRVTLDSTVLRGDSANVTVLISRYDGGPFGSEYSYEETFRLVKDGDSWRVETAPWELTLCLDEDIR